MIASPDPNEAYCIRPEKIADAHNTHGGLETFGDAADLRSGGGVGGEAQELIEGAFGLFGLFEIQMDQTENAVGVGHFGIGFDRALHFLTGGREFSREHQTHAFGVVFFGKLGIAGGCAPLDGPFDGATDGSGFIATDGFGFITSDGFGFIATDGSRVHRDGREWVHRDGREWVHRDGREWVHRDGRAFHGLV